MLTNHYRESIMPKGLNQETIDKCRKGLRNYGTWAGVRWMRNQGVEFEHAYWIMFGKLPRN